MPRNLPSLLDFLTGHRFESPMLHREPWKWRVSKVFPFVWKKTDSKIKFILVRIFITDFLLDNIAALDKIVQ